MKVVRTPFNRTNPTGSDRPVPEPAYRDEAYQEEAYRQDYRDEVKVDRVEQQALRGWGELLLEKILHPLTVIGTPAILLLMMGYFVLRNFKIDLSTGVRSFAGVLLPLIICSFLYAFQRSVLEWIGNVNLFLSFIVSLLWGIAIMVMMQLLGKFTFPAPIIEMILSGSFSVLVFTYVTMSQGRALSYYYGMITGFLIYIIAIGLPVPLR